MGVGIPAYSHFPLWEIGLVPFPIPLRDGMGWEWELRVGSDTLVGSKMFQPDFTIADMVLNGMIPYHYMLCLQVVDWVISDLDGPLVILINGSW